MGGLRDTAVIALMLCTGIREGELSALEVKDLRQKLGGELALLVLEVKGTKERLVPYGELDWCLVVVDKWLEAAGISSGPVFRGLYKGGKKLRPGRLSLRAIEYITTAYPIAKMVKLCLSDRMIYGEPTRGGYMRREQTRLPFNKIWDTRVWIRH